MNYMNQNFKTTAMNIVVENKTHSGSGFGITDQGEAVFLSMRLMEVMEVEIGDIVTAHCIPNFEDKRDQIPWRAIRVDRQSVTQDPMTAVPVRTAADVESEVMKLLSGSDVFWTTKELRDDCGMDVDTKTIGNACLRLFNKGRIAMAAVHAAPDQDRSSWNLWAANTDAFK